MKCQNACKTWKNDLSDSSAYLLVSHGSRDSRPHIDLEHLAYLVQEQLKNIDHKCEKQVPPVATATLELAPCPLHKSIIQFAQQFPFKTIEIVPLFLLQGVHVREDIPYQVALAETILGGKIKLKIHPYLGSIPGIGGLIREQFNQLPEGERILLSHGSRYPQGNQPVEKISSELKAILAYWSIEPSLTAQVELLVKQGVKRIVIVPYFLFGGGITDIFSEQVEHLQQIYPWVEFHLGKPLGATAELSELIVTTIVDILN